MRKRDQQTQVKLDLTPSNSELDRLRAAMEAKKQIRMNGRLQSRFFQVMYDWDVLKLMDNGDPMVRDPYAYTKWNQAHYMIEAADVKQEDALFEANPELKVEADRRFREFLKETREVVFGKRLINQET